LSDDGCAEIDHGREAAVGFVGAYGDALELFEFAEEVLDEMAPFVHLEIDIEGFASPWMLGDDGFRAAHIEVLDDAVGVEGLVGNQGVKLQAFDEWRKANSVEALSRQEDESFWSLNHFSIDLGILNLNRP
jgi:hypothetical protein